MDPAQTTVLLIAIGTLVPALIAASAVAAKALTACRPELPTSRLGGLVLLGASLTAISKSTPIDAAVAPITQRNAPAVPPPAPITVEPVDSAGYVVRAGDSLWAIACRHLGASGRDASPQAVDRLWRAIYESNRSAIGDDPDLIFPGARLIIPEVHT